MRTTASPTLVASRVHTGILASAFILLAVAGAYAQRTGQVQHAAPDQHELIRLYVSVLIAEWASVFYVWKGTRRRNVPLSVLVGQRWQRPADVVTDVLMAAALWGVWIVIESVLPGVNTVHSLLPGTAVEVAVWMLVALSAGFCEELVFRGYFQRQFHALTGSVAAGIALQALVFGVSHFYEGAWAVVKITMYGVLFGLVASGRKSLRPGILAHAWSDIFAIM